MGGGGYKCATEGGVHVYNACIYEYINERTHTHKYRSPMWSLQNHSQSMTLSGISALKILQDGLPRWKQVCAVSVRACVRACVLSLSLCVSECTSIQIFLSVPVCGACVWKVSCVRVCAARAHGGNGYVLCACVCSCAGVFVLRYVLCVWVVGVCVRWCVGVVVCVRVSCTGS